jgi:hypothetical protein
MHKLDMSTQLKPQSKALAAKLTLMQFFTCPCLIMSHIYVIDHLMVIVKIFVAF